MAAASNHQPPRRETVEFPPNIPTTVSLAYSEPRTVSGQFGERFMFSLSDGRVMFCDPPLAARIAELGINVRESIVITKQTSGKKDAPVTWGVARVIGEQPNGTFAVPKLPDAPAPKPPQRAANAAGGTLVDAANELIDAYAAVLKRALDTYEGRVKPEEVKSIFLTAVINRGGRAA